MVTGVPNLQSTPGGLGVSPGGTPNGTTIYDDNDSTGSNGQVLKANGDTTVSWVTSIPGEGTVTAVSVVSTNGFAGTVANSTTTPAITVKTSVSGILYGNGTSVAAAIAANFPTLNQNTTGSAGSVGAANITGTTLASTVVTSSLTSVGTLTALTVAGVLTINTQATTGTQTASFTATNKPGSNNQTTPATWIPVTLDGVVYYVPAFAA